MNSFCKKTRYLFTNAFILIMFYSVITAVAYTSWAVIDLQKSRASLTTQQVVSDETFQISSSAPDNSTTLVFVFGLVLGLLILDVWNILDYWIQAKYEEWSIRHFYGASKIEICLRINIGFMVLMIAVFLCGNGLEYLLQKSMLLMHIQLRCPMMIKVELSVLLYVTGCVLNCERVYHKEFI